MIVHVLKWFSPKPQPWEAVNATLKTLETQARLRCDTRAIARLHEARSIITHECLKVRHD